MFDNVLCETVIMHLDRAQIAPSVRRMLDIVKSGGVFYLNWRVTEKADQRDQHGRLYAAFDAALVRAELSAATTLLDEEVVSASSGKKIHRLVVRKRAETSSSLRAKRSNPFFLYGEMDCFAALAMTTSLVITAKAGDPVSQRGR